MSIATTKRDILNSLKDREFRAAWNLENVYTTVCFQLRALREQREMSQGEFGKLVMPKMAQERISILEDPNAASKPTLNTLLRLADAADVGLEVRFVPFSTVLSRSVHTDMNDLKVDSFTDELPSLEEQVAFEETLEGLEASAIGVTKASNKLFILPHQDPPALESAEGEKGEDLMANEKMERCTCKSPIPCDWDWEKGCCFCQRCGKVIRKKRGPR